MLQKVSRYCKNKKNKHICVDEALGFRLLPSSSFSALSESVSLLSDGVIGLFFWYCKLVLGFFDEFLAGGLFLYDV